MNAPVAVSAQVTVRPDGVFRRVTDIIVAALALLVLAPAMIAIALVIRLTTPGPALYLQERIGRGGRPFRMLKFRTMVIGADRGRALVTGKCDPRITRAGTVLRATKADELPQLLNVLRGHMTLIGPRPEVARYVAHYSPAERALLRVRPGLTGPGQLYFFAEQAGDLDRLADPEEHYVRHQLHPKLAFDLDYLVHRSLRGDLAVVRWTLASLLPTLWRPGALTEATGERRARVPEPVVPTDQGISPSLARKALDVTVAVTILALVWPLFPVIAVATRLSTGGSAIYRQRRVGQGGIPFTIYKFRTMRAQAAGPEVTAPDDHRVTRLGALMRKTSIDELPQLVNVLLGHMTLVGPRPESVALAMRYPEELRFVFRYRPGVTGPCQVLVRDEKVLDRAVDVEKLYLTKLVAHRVDMDLDYLKDPTLARTVQWVVATLLYLLVCTVMPRPATARLEFAGAAALGRLTDD
jgi:lipopolysaccharide/colanic/teichoic acid biosynthesis glycosyltransferase